MGQKLAVPTWEAGGATTWTGSLHLEKCSSMLASDMAKVSLTGREPLSSHTS